MKPKIIPLLAVAVLVAVKASGQIPPEALKGVWHAQWITCANAPQRDSVVLHFRKVFELSEVPVHFPVRVSADNRFILDLNQHEVGRGPALSDLAHWKYETYDLAPFLHQGRNELAATVWNFGALSQLAQISDRTAFVLAGENDAQQRIVDTDSTWEVEEDKGVQALPVPRVKNFYYAAEPVERITGALFDWSWNNAAGSLGKWEKAAFAGLAIERGAVLQNNNWELVQDPLPPMQMELSLPGHLVRSSGVQVPENFPESALEIPAHTTATLLINQSHLTTAYPELTVSAGAGSNVRLTYAEALVDEEGEKGNRNEIAGKHIIGNFDEFVPDGGEGRTFVPLAWRTWRYLQLEIKTADQPLRIEKLRSWFTAYPFEERGRFESDDPSLAQIWQIGWRTARLDAHETYMDTSYWERLQYIGDTRSKL